MRNLTLEEKQLLSQLIKGCEYHHLSEKQSIECINKVLKGHVSRRSYYNYKRKIYSHDVFDRLKESIYSSSLDKSALLLLNDNSNLEVRTKVNKLIADQFPDKDKPTFLLPSHHDEYIENMKDKENSVFMKIIQFQEMEKLSKARFNAIPKNVTIKEEFIKCGKDACNRCPHGPYYYAYWRDKTKDKKGKLQKKYLGFMDLRLKS